MNILFISKTLPPSVDGVGDYTLNIAKEFGKHGHNVSLICQKSDGIITDYENLTVLPIVESWNAANGKNVNNVIRDRKIEAVCLQYVPHGFEPHGLPFRLISFLKEVKKSDVPIFTFLHEVYWRYRGTNLKWLAESFLMAEISKRIIKLSDYVATSIAYYAKYIADLSGRTAQLIPIASNIPPPEFDAHVNDILQDIAPNDEFVISFIGRRNITIVCKALSKMIADGYKIKMLFIGKTNEPVGIEDKHIYRTGILPIEKLSQYVAVADCMIMPENKDSGCSFKSGSLAAALSLGIPVVTNKGYLTENRLENKKNIVFVNPELEEELCNAITELIRNKRAKEFISQGAKAIGEQLTWERTYDDYMKILHIDR